MDVHNAVRLAMGLRTTHSAKYNAMDLSHPNRHLNDRLNTYQKGSPPPPGSSHYNWTNENEVIIDVQVEMSGLHPTWTRFGEAGANRARQRQIRRQDMQ
eukprot:SAG31_NODE_12196_length_959_cov_83.473256_2_plen_98_part_01